MSPQLTTSKIYAEKEIWIFSSLTKAKSNWDFIVAFSTLPLNKKGIINHPYPTPVEL